MSDTRRSSRISLAIPVEVAGVDGAGAFVTEAASTVTLSRHGALLLLQHRFPVDSEISISIPHLERKQTCRVVWLMSSLAGGAPYETGVELDSAENFWGVRFPPEDWVAPKQQPLAGTQPRPAPSTIIGNPEQQLETLTGMVHALIAVLKEKGVVTSSELAEMLKRLS